VGRAFVKGVQSPLTCRVILEHVHIAKQSRRWTKTDEEWVAELMKRVEVNDACAMCVIARYCHHGAGGLQQDKERAKNLWTQAAELGSSDAHFHLGRYYDVWGDSKKSKFHYETAAMAGYDDARFNLGYDEYHAGNVERAVKHWIIAASSGNHRAMNNVLVSYNQGLVSRDTMDSTLIAYNNSCADMRSEARDAAIRMLVVNN
jgi:TPR repeat protein